MVTDKYLTVHHHATVEEFKVWCDQNKIPIIGIDNLPISKQLENYDLPAKCVMLFGQEGAGMSDEGVAVCEVVLAISQYGSTRSMNASAAGAIAMYAWAMQHLQSCDQPQAK
jgi:tRNA G18 (ribose-2'-O)-methylase SpoU